VIARRNAVVLGGAGFIGSHVTRAFLGEGYRVVVVDGLLPASGGRVEHVPDESDVVFLQESVESCSTLPEVLANAQVVVDCMGWTRHREALLDPLHDLRLNQQSHLHVLRALAPKGDQRVIYLGSRGQFGNAGSIAIAEDAVMQPLDIQGIHKVAAESYYRAFAEVLDIRVASLRLPACFGENAPAAGPDIGLIGGFIRDLLSRGQTTVYAPARRRSFAYAGDVAATVVRLAGRVERGFAGFNLAGHTVGIGELVELLIEFCGKGEMRVEDMPGDVAAFEMGSAEMSEERLRTILGDVPRTDFRVALKATVGYFRTALT
jgi:nucleoside-diphosphate-sugar epimerase